jgi:hypothetical protein
MTACSLKAQLLFGPITRGVTIWKPQDTECPQSVTLRLSRTLHRTGSELSNEVIPFVFNKLAFANAGEEVATEVLSSGVVAGVGGRVPPQLKQP